MRLPRSVTTVFIQSCNRPRDCLVMSCDQLEINRIGNDLRCAGMVKRGVGNYAVKRAFCLLEFYNEIRKVRNVCVPLQERRNATRQFLGQLIQMPQDRKSVV